MHAFRVGLHFARFFLFEQVQVLKHVEMITNSCESSCCLLELINDERVAASVDELFAHLQMTLFGSPEQASLSIIVKMVDIVSVFYQQLGALVSALTCSKKQRRPSKFVTLIQVVPEL